VFDIRSKTNAINTEEILEAYIKVEYWEKNRTSKIKAIIVDDELHGRENLKKIIELYCKEIEVVGCATSVVEAN